MKKISLIVAPVAALTVLVASANAFFDEIEELKEELQVWQTTHAADFSDIVEQLDDITGPVFSDVSSNDWYNAYVSSLAEWGIVSGYRDGKGKLTGDYVPGNSVTIAESLKMAMEAAQIDLSQCKQAAEHPQSINHWSEDYVACAEDMDMRMFRFTVSLDRPARRAEVLAIVHDAFGDSVLPLYSSFSDTKGHLLEADVALATIRGIVSGDTDSEGNNLETFRPNDPINRAETAKIIYEKIKEQAREEAAL